MSRVPATSAGVAPKPPGQLQPYPQRKLRGRPPPSAPSSGRWNPSSRPGGGAPVEVHSIPRVAPKPIASGISVRKMPKPSLEQLIKTCQHYEFKVAHRYDTKSMAARLLFQLSHEIQELVVALMNAGFGRSPKLEHLETITTEWREIFSNPVGPVPPAVQALARKTPRQVAEYVQQQADKIAAMEAAAEDAKGAQAAEVGRLREAMRSQAAVGGNSFEREMQRLREMYEDKLQQERAKHHKELETVKTQTEEKHFAALQQERKATADKDCQKDVVVTPTKQRQKQLIESLQGRLHEREAQVAQLEARIEELRRMTQQRLAEKDDEIARSVASSLASDKNLEQATAEFKNRASYPRLVWLEGRHSWLEGRTNELGEMIGKLQTRLEDCHQHCRGSNYRDAAAQGASPVQADAAGGARGATKSGAGADASRGVAGSAANAGGPTAASAAVAAARRGTEPSTAGGSNSVTQGSTPSLAADASDKEGTRGARVPATSSRATACGAHPANEASGAAAGRCGEQHPAQPSQEPWNPTTNPQSFSFPPGTAWEAVVQTLGGAMAGPAGNGGASSGRARHDFRCKPKKKRCMAVVERAVSAPFPHHCRTVCVKAGTAGRHLAQAGTAAACCGNDFEAAPVSAASGVGKADCCSGCRDGARGGATCEGSDSGTGNRGTAGSHACATCCGQPSIRNMRKFRNLHGSTNETYGFAWRSWLRNYCDRAPTGGKPVGGCPNVHHLRCCPELGMGAASTGV